MIKNIANIVENIMCSIIDPIEKYLFEIQVHSQGYIKLSGYVMSKFY